MYECVWFNLALVSDVNVDIYVYIGNNLADKHIHKASDKCTQKSSRVRIENIEKLKSVLSNQKRLFR